MLSVAIACSAAIGAPTDAASQKFDHKFKGAGHKLVVGSEFERKHGILPGGVGFVYDGVSGAEANSTERGRRQIQSCERLYGMFVRPCESAGTFQGQPISTVDTRYYATNGQYELDRTYYVGDSQCKPNSSDIYYKLNLHGTVEFRGVNQQLKPGGQPSCPNSGTNQCIQGCKAGMTWTSTDIILGTNPYSAGLAAQLNTHCPCGHNWTTSPTEELHYHVNASQCGNEVNPNDNTIPTLCHWLAGGEDYYSYAYVPPAPNQQYYITSRDDFVMQQGWINHINPSYTRELIKGGGSHNPSDCEGAVWAECATAIQNAERNCRSCIGLECDGCLFREVNPQWDPASMMNPWHRCCPCIYEYAEMGMGDRDWLQTLC